MLRKLRQERFPNASQYRAALAQYGIAEEQLKGHLLWQLTAIRFTDQRFQAATPAPAAQDANHSASDGSDGEGTVDQQMNSWLKDARGRSRIDFKKGAFE